MAEITAGYAFPHTSADERRRLDLAQPLISTGLVTAAETAGLTARVDESDFTGCGFAFIGAWGMRR